MKAIIDYLWENEKLPVKDALYFSNGAAFSLIISPYPHPNIQKKGWFYFKRFYEKNKSEVTSFNIIKKVNLLNGNHFYLGEGSCGSEGFIAYLNNNKDLIWLIYSESSNPFINLIEKDSKTVIIESSALLKLKINMNVPLNVEIQW